jgi:hypothetical protein
VARGGTMPHSSSGARQTRGHKGKTHGGTGKGLGRDFEKLSVSKRDSPVRHAAGRRHMRPGQLQIVSPPPRPATATASPSAPLPPLPPLADGSPRHLAPEC